MNQDQTIKQKPKKPIGAEIRSWVVTIALVLVLALCINQFVIVNATVPTGSMEDTIMPQDRIIALRLTYYVSHPQRGDIVVFRFPDNEELLYVKRVIGLPGETVEIRDGRVYIDGSAEPLPDEYVKGRPTGNYGPYEVPEGCYFMLGDNRENSEDSRFWVNKYVQEDKILGKVYFRYFPSLDWLA